MTVIRNYNVPFSVGKFWHMGRIIAKASCSGIWLVTIQSARGIWNTVISKYFLISKNMILTHFLDFISLSAPFSSS